MDTDAKKYFNSIKKIGILGFGIVGRSALKFLKSLNSNFYISIWDKKKLNQKDLNIIESSGAFLFEGTLEDFISFNEQIVISPGFKKDLIKKYNHKCLCELDILQKYFNKKTIAVTGTLGKTSVVTLLQTALSFLENKQNIISAGNIGNGMLDLIEQNKNIDMAVLELSSFQLAFSKEFAPDIALFTNFHPNHLDWHGDELDYFESKCKIFEYQNRDQSLIVDASFIKNKSFLQKLKNAKSKVYFVSTDSFDIKVAGLKNCFYIKKNNFYFNEKKIFDLNVLPNLSYLQNRLYVLATIYILGYDLTLLHKYFEHQKTFLLPHRLEHFTNIRGVDFFNDSKATVPQATLAALNQMEMQNKSIILILGGVDKGVDRSLFVQELSKFKKIKKIFYFGHKDKSFASFEYYPSLRDLINAIMQIAKSGDQVLFSPSGASFDLFKNYMQRGEEFKKLVFSLE